MARAGRSTSQRRRAQRARAPRSEPAASLLPHLYEVYDSLIALRILCARKLHSMVRVIDWVQRGDTWVQGEVQGPDKRAWTWLARDIATSLEIVEPLVKKNRLAQQELPGLYCSLVQRRCRWECSFRRRDEDEEEVLERLTHIIAEFRQVLIGRARGGGRPRQVG